MTDAPEQPAEAFIDPVSGLPALTLGQPIAAADVAQALDEE